MTKPRTNGFTLIEMLTVIVIIGIVVAMTIPAVTNLMKSGGVSAASREVANTLGLARQLAITQRTFARVVFPCNLPQTPPDVSPPEMWYRTYAVMTNRDNSVAAAAGWAYASKWEYLPVGAVFLDKTHIGLSPSPPPLHNPGALDDTDFLNEQRISFPIPGNLVNKATIAYIEFGPTGTATPLTVGGGASVLAMTEGFVGGTPPAPTPTTTKTSGGTLANLTTISVDSLVGRIQVARP
jgi:prepilin-type N-terminal cleavage/methylation domain-containing protein